MFCCSKAMCRLPLVLMVVLVNLGQTCAQDRSPFTVVILPDTQLYAESFPEIYAAQTTWIKQLATKDRVRFVIHMGDIVQNPGAEHEWQNADRAHQVLDDVVPYSMLPGNHDMIGDSAPLYNNHFGPERFAKQAWYGGHWGKTNDHNFCTFTAGRMKFLVLSLGYNPPDEVLRWANEICETHPEHRIIVATHEYLVSAKHDRRTEMGNRIWDQLIRKQNQIFMVLCGHLSPPTLITHLNDQGSMVHQIMTNYQELPQGGSGYLRTMRFVPEEDKIYVQTYSPWLERYQDDPRHSYQLAYPMRSLPIQKTENAPHVGSPASSATPTKE